MVRKYLAIASLLLPLLACEHSNQQSPTTTQQEPQLYWTKASYTQQNFNSDRYECLQSSIAQSQPNGSVVIPNSDTNWMQMVNQSNLFNACMQAKGYTLQPLSAIPTASTASSSLANISDEEASYCLTISQLGLKNMEKGFKKDKDSEREHIPKLAIDHEKNAIQSLKERLATDNLYSLSNDQPSPRIHSQTKMAETDFKLVYQDKHYQCTEACTFSDPNTTLTASAKAFTDYNSCYRACDNEMDDSDKRVSECFNLFPFSAAVMSH